MRRVLITTTAAVLAVTALAASPAAAKSVTKAATFNQCISPASPILGKSLTVANLNIAVPKNGRKVQSGVVTAVGSAGVRATYDAGVGDFNVSLVSPGGRAIGLAIQRDANGQSYGTGARNCSGEQVLFSDSFGTPIADPGNTGTSPILGNFKPEQPLSSFVGGPARGVWTLLVSTCCSSPSVGTLDAFSLNLTYSFRKPVKKQHKK
jgi:subtilisin-like proprotein convertase family protein